MLTLVIEIAGKTFGDLDSALELVKQQVSEAHLSGFNLNFDSSFENCSFNVSGVEEVEEEVNKMRAIDWNKLTMIGEQMPKSDGGGWRCYFKELGFAVYGQGKTLEEATQDCIDNEVNFQNFVDTTPEYQLPQNLFTDS